MTLSRYVLGVAGLTVVIGPVIFTAVVLRRRWLAGWSGAPARVAEAVLSVAILIGIAELLGVLGLFRPGFLALASVAFGLATWRIGAPEGSEVHRPAPPVPDGIATGIAALLTASVVSFWTASLARALKGGMLEPDTLAYHAPMAARFVQEHSTAHPFFATGEQVLTFVPANTELLHAIGILVMGSDVLSPLLNLGWLVLALAAAWAIGRPYGRGPATLAGAAVALATPKLVSLEPGAALNDVAVVALLLSIAALLVNGGRQPAPIVLAGLVAGLAAGTKATALVPVAVLTIAAIALVRRGQRVKTGGLWLGAVLLGGGFWYIRNFVAFGTPVPSVRIGIGPVALPSIETRPAYTVAHYATDWHIWDTWFLPALNDSLGPAWWALLGLAALGMAASLAQRSLPALRAVSILAISVAVVYPFTPHSADGPEGSPYIFSSTLRFFIPAVALGLVILPLARSLKARTRQRLVLIGFAILTLAALYDSRGQVEDHPVAAALAAAVVAGSFALARAGRLVRNREVGAGGLIARSAAGYVGLIVLGAGLVWQVEGRFLRDRYLSSWARTLQGVRIGTVGTLAYPLYGRDLSNHVQHVARRGPHGAFRRIPSCPEWRQALTEGRYRYVAISTAVNLIRAAHGQGETHMREAAWTASDPAATPLSVPGGDQAVFRVDGRLDPKACDESAVRRIERKLREGIALAELHLQLRVSDEQLRRTTLRMTNGHGVIAWLGKDIVVAPGTVRGAIDSMSISGGRLMVHGWAADTDRRRVADWLLGFSNGRLLAVTAPAGSRPDVAEAYGITGVEFSGFTLTAPTNRAKRSGDPSALRVFALAGNRASELVPPERATLAPAKSRE